jgi:CelD/BcsL family acetyltransferase involved in cellulose biosynthesis
MDEIVRGREGFAALGPHWEKLAASGGVETPFQSYSWLDLWLQHRGFDIEPFILVLHGGETIAPLGWTRRAGIRVLRLLGSPDSDYPGLVTTRSVDESWDGLARALAEHRRSFDLLHLGSVRHREPVRSALARHVGTGGRERPYEVCPLIATNRSWPEFLAAQGSGLRNEVKRWNRRMQELGAVTTERVHPPVADTIVSEIIDVERTSWKWGQGSAAFREESQRNFISAVLGDSRSGLAGWLLRVEGKLVAYAVVLTDDTRWYYYLTSFRKDFANAGSLLLSHIVEAACTENCTVLDLLRGDHGYKRAWTNVTNPVYEIAWPANVLGRAATLGYAARWRAAQSERLVHLRSRVLRIGDRRRRPS